tara:strand:+ start:3222 stop:3413 length:192 start_codon:yes stop_codon:yes gene_type:complete
MEHCNELEDIRDELMAERGKTFFENIYIFCKKEVSVFGSTFTLMVVIIVVIVLYSSFLFDCLF